jgi:hypothetical protein
VLDKGRELGGSVFVTIDADELLSDELIDKLNNIVITPGFGVYCQWRHLINRHQAKNNCINESQGIMFYDDGSDYFGREMVHENKIPQERLSNNLIYINEILLHFGACDRKFTDLKEAYYMCKEMQEGRYLPEINLRYNGGLDILTPVNATYNVDDAIFDLSSEYEKIYNKIVKFYNDFEPKEAVYLLNIWNVPELIERCNVDKSKVLLGNRSKIVLIMMYYQAIDIIKRKEFKRFINFFLWHIFRREYLLI